MGTGNHPAITAIISFKSGIEYASDQGTFSASGHAGNHGHDIERKTHINAFEIIFCSAGQFNIIAPRSSIGRNDIVNRFFLRRTGIEEFAAMNTSFRTYLNDVIRGTDDVLVMLHHHNGVVEVSEFLENMNQSFRIPRVQADRRLVQDI